MCGIAGVVSKDSRLVSRTVLRRMTDSIAHRGPDGSDEWINPSGVAGLGHRRLAIIDLSNAAAQPMHYLARYTIIHNGEIYNYIELRDVLAKKGYVFQTQSDTEVILAAYDHWKEACVQHFEGMFAFALWDDHEQVLFCARDRFGEKPLYYHCATNAFHFGSEIKALFAAGVERAINEPALLNYLALGYTSPVTDKSVTFYREIFALPAGHTITVKATDPGPLVTAYFDLDTQTDTSISEVEAIQTFTQLFTASIKRRLRSDVSVGSSLSGGLDSSSVVAVMHKVTLESKSFRQKTFTATFAGFDKDESTFASTVARQFSLEHFLIAPGAEDFATDLIPFVRHHEEPISSASVYAQFRVFGLARQQNVKVLLDGQGADELLAGYPKFVHWYLQHQLASRLHIGAEMNALAKNGVPFKWGWKNYLAAFFPAQAAQRLEVQEVRKLRHNADINPDFREQFFYRDSIYKPIITNLASAQYFSIHSSGLDELLRYADRNSMAHGCEVRLPFLDHELAAFLISLPAEYKIHNGWMKWLLRKSMENALPPDIAWRQGKIAFEPPQLQWMQNERVQQLITASKENLVQNKVLSAGVLSKKNQPHNAYAADGYDWRYLVAGILLD